MALVRHACLEVVIMAKVPYPTVHMFYLSASVFKSVSILTILPRLHLFTTFATRVLLVVLAPHWSLFPLKSPPSLWKFHSGTAMVVITSQLFTEIPSHSSSALEDQVRSVVCCSNVFIELVFRVPLSTRTKLLGSPSDLA